WTWRSSRPTARRSAASVPPATAPTATRNARSCGARSRLPPISPTAAAGRRAIAVPATLTDRSGRPAMLAEAEELVTDMHAEAVEAFLAANGMPPSEGAVGGFHGQTVLHRPDRGLTIQLGNGAALAGRLGIPVVYDFRAADVA